MIIKPTQEMVKLQAQKKKKKHRKQLENVTYGRVQDQWNVERWRENVGGVTACNIRGMEVGESSK